MSSNNVEEQKLKGIGEHEEEEVIITLSDDAEIVRHQMNEGIPLSSSSLLPASMEGREVVQMKENETMNKEADYNVVVGTTAIDGDGEAKDDASKNEEGDKTPAQVDEKDNIIIIQNKL